MAWDNSLSQLDNPSHEMKKWSASIYFKDKPKRLIEWDWQNIKRNNRHTMPTKKYCKNTVAWQIDTQEKLSTKIYRNSDKILKMILDMRTINTGYLD